MVGASNVSAAAASTATNGARAGLNIRNIVMTISYGISPGLTR
jgi:hypothetical protein